MCRVEIFWETLTKYRDRRLIIFKIIVGGARRVFHLRVEERRYFWNPHFLSFSFTNRYVILFDPSLWSISFHKSINPFLRDYSEMIKKKKSYEFSFKARLKTRSVRSQRGKIGKKKGNTESSLRGYRVKTRQASEERENLLWNHAVTNPAQRRITELYPLLPLNPWWHGAQPESPHRWRQPRYTVSTRCPVYSSVRVSRGRKRNTEFEEGYRRRRKMEEGGEQTLGNAACTNCILVFFVLERDSEETFTWSMLARCSFLADRVSSRYDFPESTQSGSFDLAEGNRGRLPCGFARQSWNNKVVGVPWKRAKFVHLIFIYTRYRAKGGSRNWLYF